MTRTILAGDVGGTKTLLALYAVTDTDQVVLTREERFASPAYDTLETIVHDFLRTGTEKIEAAVFGLPGPVLDGEVQVTNLPWKLSHAGLAQATGCSRVRLMNDLETTAYGSLFLASEEVLTLNRGKQRNGNRAVIAAGTGLGQGLLFWDGERHWPAATEGGHTDFAPRTEQEDALLAFLRKRYRRVSYERVVSGPGLVNILDFLTQEQQKVIAPFVRERVESEDPAEVIGEAGVQGWCPTCTEAVDLLLGIYGAQAGNLALTVMALGGVYIGGGIITKLLPRLSASHFLPSFLDKGRHSPLMAEIPLHVILNPQTSQLGAAHAAKDLLPTSHP
ncbi:MAG: glucokinase [Deltaproteobacteria bacterium]|nr:glucokinase [Deltaproteobacteria bacterium]